MDRAYLIGGCTEAGKIVSGSILGKTSLFDVNYLYNLGVQFCYKNSRGINTPSLTEIEDGVLAEACGNLPQKKYYHADKICSAFRM